MERADTPASPEVEKAATALAELLATFPKWKAFVDAFARLQPLEWSEAVIRGLPPKEAAAFWEGCEDFEAVKTKLCFWVAMRWSNAFSGGPHYSPYYEVLNAPPYEILKAELGLRSKAMCFFREEEPRHQT